MQGRQFDSTVRTERVVEQMLNQHHTDILRLLKRIAQLESSWGIPPGNQDGTGSAFGFSGGAGGTVVGLGKTDASVSAGGSVTVSVYDPGATPAGDTDSTDNVTCYSRVDIDANVFVNWIDRGDYNECFPLECNA